MSAIAATASSSANASDLVSVIPPATPEPYAERFDKLDVDPMYLARFGMLSVWRNESEFRVQLATFQWVNITVRLHHLKSTKREPVRLFHRVILAFCHEMLECALARYGSILHTHAKRGSAMTARSLYNHARVLLSDIVNPKSTMSEVEELQNLNDFETNAFQLVQRAEVIFAARAACWSHTVQNGNVTMIPPTTTVYAAQSAHYRNFLVQDAYGCWEAPRAMKPRPGQYERRKAAGKLWLPPAPRIKPTPAPAPPPTAPLDCPYSPTFPPAPRRAPKPAPATVPVPPAPVPVPPAIPAPVAAAPAIPANLFANLSPMHTPILSSFTFSPSHLEMTPPRFQSFNALAPIPSLTDLLDLDIPFVL
jgi:hypothetical protein